MAGEGHSLAACWANQYLYLLVLGLSKFATEALSQRPAHLRALTLILAPTCNGLFGELDHLRGYHNAQVFEEVAGSYFRV